MSPACTAAVKQMAAKLCWHMVCTAHQHPHVLLPQVVAGEQPAFMRRRDGLEELAAVARRLMHATHNAGLKQAAADALSVLGARRLGYA